jgi:hypothetical protein
VYELSTVKSESLETRTGYVTLTSTLMATHLEYHRGSSLSLDGGTSGFAVGELVLVRIPKPIQIDGQIEDDATR